MDSSCVYYADLSACEPRWAFSREQAAGSWFPVDYETEEGLQGTMVYGLSSQSPPALRLGLGRGGWHALYVGVNYTRTPEEEGVSAGTVRVRLTRDPGWTIIGPEPLYRQAVGYYSEKMGHERERFGSVYEVFWKNADLTGQSLHVATPWIRFDATGRRSYLSNVAWVRAVPLGAREIELVRRDAPSEDTRRLAACYCLAHLFSGAMEGTQPVRPTDEQVIRDLIEPFRESDFRLLCLEVIRGDMCAFPTSIGRVGPAGESWDPSWIDPLSTAVRLGHDCGLEVYASLRMMGPGYPVRLNALEQNPYYWANRQYTAKDEGGRDTSILSLAYPHIREHWVSLLGEAVERGADGIHLCLNRANPFVLYEEPVLASFMDRHGVDPRSLPFDDERWLRHRASYVTRFLREIRAMLDAAAAARGRRLGVAVTFWHDPSPLHFALDVEAWVREGLVDYLLPHWIHLAKDDGPAIVARIRALARGGSVRIYPDLYPRGPPGEEYASKCAALYDAGADGFSFWSTEYRAPRASEWAVLKRLGHRGELDRYRLEAPSLWRRVPLREIGGISTHHSHTDG